MVYKNKEEKNNIPILKVLKGEYNLFNVFLVFFSILFMGICQTLKYSYFKNNPNFRYFFFFFFFLFFCFFLCGIFPFIKKIFQEFYLISWPSYKKIFFKMIQVFCFSFVLECIIYFLSYLYDKIDPIL
ncbi:preprotein translocase subunit SecE [Candidatus Phytoplasma oryzae]|nr:preprotein translocase subunit SecE [Candidatus Phytoplasma oryzae]